MHLTCFHRSCISKHPIKEFPPMLTRILRSFGILFLGGLTAAAQAQGPKSDTDKKPDANETKKSDEAKKPEPPKEKPFADVMKESKTIKGLFTLYPGEDQVYLEIQPEQFDRMYMLSMTCDSSIGEAGLYAAEMCGETPIVFHKHGKNVQLIAKNTRFIAQEGSPMQRAVAHSFSDSILGATKLESLPHPDRKSVLIDIGALLLTDLPMMGFNLEATFRIPYHFDPKNSYFGTLKAFDHNIEVETVSHYATNHPPVQPLLLPAPPPPPLHPPPRNLPDARAFQSLSRLTQSNLPPPASG